MLVKAPDSLRADFQRFYGLDLDDVGHGIRCRRAADLAAHLPPEACVWRVLDPRMEWTVTDWLLAEIADNTGFNAWTKTKDASRANARWKGRITRPGDHERGRRADVNVMDVDTLRRMLDMPRGETERTIDHGR
jgi:hypothetical protein|nr:MAG TPA: protein of unknown function (DUF5361) [Caudoviricetes sp.]